MEGRPEDSGKESARSGPANSPRELPLSRGVMQPNCQKEPFKPFLAFAARSTIFTVYSSTGYF